MQILNFILDIIFPKICLSCDHYSDSYICEKCLGKIKFVGIPSCPICEKPTRFGESHVKCKKRRGIDGLTVGIDYSDETVQKIIHEFKYKGITNSASELVEKFLYPKIRVGGVSVTKGIKITFVPMHPDKERKRGYNQSEILAREIGRVLNLPVVKLLKRVKYNASQMSLKKMEDRKKNVEGIFRPEASSLIFTGMNIILVDDVTTTGATLFEAVRVLKENGAGWVWGTVLARKQKI